MAARFNCVLKFPVPLLVGVSIDLNCEGVRLNGDRRYCE